MGTDIDWMRPTPLSGIEVFGPGETLGDGVTVDDDKHALSIGTAGVVEGRLEELREWVNRLHYRLDEADPMVDTSSSMSRQHYIDTGHHVGVDGACPCDEVEEYDHSRAKEDARNEAYAGSYVEVEAPESLRHFAETGEYLKKTD